MLETAITIMGWVGMALLLGAYGLRSRLSSPSYAGLNVLGALLIAAFCFWQKAWPPMALNIAWSAIGLRDLWIARVRGSAGGSE